MNGRERNEMLCLNSVQFKTTIMGIVVKIT